MSTTIGVMHNLPVLWLAVGLLPIGHALVFPIVGQWKVALLLCVVHAVQCAVSVPGLWSRQQWQLVWVGPRVLLCSRAATGRRGGLRPAMAQRLRPTLRSWPPVSVSLSPLHLKSHPQTAMDWEKDDGSDESTPPPQHPPTPPHPLPTGPNDPGFGSAFVQWTDLLQINKSTCKHVFCPILVLLQPYHHYCYYCFGNDLLFACVGGCRFVFLSYTLVLFRLESVTPLLLKTAG